MGYNDARGVACHCCWDATFETRELCDFLDGVSPEDISLMPRAELRLLSVRANSDRDPFLVVGKGKILHRVRVRHPVAGLFNELVEANLANEFRPPCTNDSEREKQ